MEINDRIRQKSELKRFLSPNLFLNAVAFLRLDEDLRVKEIKQDSNDIVASDYMRVHPSEIELLDTIIQ